jgi:alpha-D-xyloside xylohydrolase
LNSHLLALALLFVSSTALASSFEQTSDGVLVTPSAAPAKKVRITVIAPNVMRVTAFPQDSTELPASLMAVRTTGEHPNFAASEKNGAVVLSTNRLTAEIAQTSGRVTFRNERGEVVLAEAVAGRAFSPITVEGRSFYSIRQQFESPADEAFYGLGQHQSGRVNHKNEDVELAQHNMDIGIPFLVSSRNYGILWDNNSITRFGDPRPWQPLNQTLKLYDAKGTPGGLTATYSVDGQTKLTRTESDLDYQYLNTRAAHFPAELNKVKNVKVVWEGRIEAETTGRHTFTLYASDYNKLWIDGKLIIDAWRQNWNPWYRDFSVDMQAGKPRAIRIEWTSPTEGAYLAFQHRDPLPVTERNNLSLWSEVGHAIDYYVVTGANADEVIAGYRLITGKATILPKWAYGFWQSRERYKTQDELVGAVRDYRQRGIPLDNIVQDWMYWKEDSWGSHEFDAPRFPDPQQMVKDIHDQHAHVMISVWAKFYPTTANFKELAAKGHVYPRNLEQPERDWVGPGYASTFYDPYSAEARQIYWRQINEKLNKLGIDAWWLDSVEPDMHSNLDIAERKLRMQPTAMGPGAEVFNTFALVNARGVYEGSRQVEPDKRVFILTRSGTAGLQRYAAANWSGDIASRWSDLHDQVAAGVGYSISGTPNWTLDIGGFSVEPRYEAKNPTPAVLQEWHELNLRWFQFGAFLPLFRSHGQFPLREIYNLAPEGSKLYDTLVDYVKLRYRLMPYIYTLGADTYHRDYTIMRGLVMDFPADRAVRSIDDQYMFGPAFLVCPVYQYGATTRSVYLPASAQWHDFYSGKVSAGGSRITAAAPLEQMPLFVKSGSIVPTGPVTQYVDEKPDAPVTLQVYTGANGTFTLYEDAGTTYGYERGEFARIRFAYDDAAGTLTIEPRDGRYPGLIARRTFNVRWIGPGIAGARQFEAQPDQSVEYSGAKLVIRRAATPR